LAKKIKMYPAIIKEDKLSTSIFSILKKSNEKLGRYNELAKKIKIYSAIFCLRVVQNANATPKKKKGARGRNDSNNNNKMVTLLMKLM